MLAQEIVDVVTAPKVAYNTQLKMWNEISACPTDRWTANCAFRRIAVAEQLDSASDKGRQQKEGVGITV